MSSAGIAPFDVTNAEIWKDPYPVYHQYRSADPVHEGVPSAYSKQQWFLFRYDDVTEALRNPNLGREKQIPFRETSPAKLPEEARPFWEAEGLNMVHRDPPAHTRLRGMINKTFTAEAVEKVRPWAHELADQLISAAKQKGQMDLVADFAFPYTSRLIARVVGIPYEYLHGLDSWADARRCAMETRNQKLDASTRSKIFMTAGQSVHEFNAELHKLFAERRANPTDDLLSSMIEANDGESKLSNDELLAMCRLLASAGHETTTKTITSGMYALLSNPDQLELLKQKSEFIPTAFNEMLRYHPVVHLVLRLAYKNITFGSKQIPEGATVTMMLASANRDPEIFKAPDRFDVTRPMTPAHLTFSCGIHRCVGSTLAKVEGEIAIASLLREMPNMSLLEESPTQTGVGFRGFNRLMVTF